MEVSVLPFNEVEVVDKIYTACRTCYMSGTPQEQYKKTQEDLTGKAGWDKKWKLIHHVIKSGHHSTLEHVSFTFLISGVSRALSHQLVRHRMASYSQQSQRYCEFKDGNFEFVYPPSVLKNTETIKIFDECIEKISQTYSELINLGIPAEDARMVLPNACCTNITCSMNIRELIHFMNERQCTCAQWEIRHLAFQMAELITNQIPELKEYLAPKCQQLGYCPESYERTCGRRPLKEVFLK